MGWEVVKSYSLDRAEWPTRLLKELRIWFDLIALTGWPHSVQYPSKHREIFKDIQKEQSHPQVLVTCLTPMYLRCWGKRELGNPKGNQAWIFIGRSDAEVEAPILWPPEVKDRLIGEDLDAGKDWGQEEKEGTWSDGITHSMDMSLSKLRELGKDREEPGLLQSMGLQRVGHDLVTRQQ